MGHRSGAWTQQEEHVEAYKRAYDILKMKGMAPKLLKFDNEPSKLLASYLEEERVDYKFVKAHMHRQNAAERVIRTFKIYHFRISIM